MQDLAGTALRRAHLAARLSCGTFVSGHAHLAARPSHDCLTSGGFSRISGLPVPSLTPSSSIEGRFFVHFRGNVSKRVAVFETSFDRKRTRDARFTATRSEMFDLPPHIRDNGNADDLGKILNGALRLDVPDVEAAPVPSPPPPSPPVFPTAHPVRRTLTVSSALSTIISISSQKRTSVCFCAMMIS